MSATAYTKTIVLDSLLLGQPFPILDNFVLGLFASGTEVSAAEYERQPITFDTAYANDTRIVFPMAQSSWGSPNQAILIGAGNNQIAIGTISPGAVTAGYRIVAEIGNITVDLT